MQVLKVKYSDLSAPETFCESLRTTGFAVLTDHPISMDSVNTVYRKWKEFFANEEKHKYTFNVETQAGYFPFKSEHAKGYNIKDLKEFFHVYPRSTLPDWLAQDTWKLYKDLVQLATTMLGWIDAGTPEEIRSKFSMPLSQMIQNSEEILLRIIHYPPLTGGEEQGAIRAAAHEDINLITLLCSATTAGLQVKDLNGNWHDVPCDPGSIAINAGDMLQMATDGYYKSTTHQVVNPIGAEAKESRFSMPLFLHPRSDVLLKPDISAGQYLKQRLQEIGLMGDKK